MGPKSALTFKQVCTKIAGFFQVSRSKEETGAFGNRYCKCDSPNR